MCGIAGYAGRGAPEVIGPMLKRLAHRGPDDTGTHREPGVAIGATRLAIIDLVSGHQPIANEDETVRVVLNGEIYNFRALRRDLERGGHRFRTNTDTEVIVHAYEAHGTACVERLRGMFAFAIWDRPRQRLVLARDRLGKKPLYYWHAGGLFVFASEIKALLCHPAVGRELDVEALHHYLAFGYTPADRSIFAGIRKLPPGHVAVLHEDVFAARPYWTLPAPAPGGPRSEPREALATRVRDVVKDAVRARLESDVPVGVFLSGGIDSSAIVASMRELTGSRIATFSVGFGTPSFDELRYARLVAERFETDHHEDVLAPDVEALVPDIVRAFDEPFGDSSAVPTFVVAQATSRHVKVVLSGIGGDEVFAGYPRYLGVRLAERYARLPGALRSPLGALARLVPDTDRSRNLGDWARRFVEAAHVPMPDRYIRWTRFFGEPDLRALVAPGAAARWTEDVERSRREAFAARRDGDTVDGAFRVDLAAYLPDDLLVMADRMSMAHSLELRAPFCDQEVIATSLGLPSSVKIPGFRLKAVLKDAFARVLPPAVLSRPKQGFMIPLNRWLRVELGRLVDDLLAPDRVRARGIFVPAVVERLKHEHRSGRRVHGDRLWTLMMFELWAREYLDGAGTWSFR
jgi:asparagine synthase (glutamine-hydrolysing)